MDAGTVPGDGGGIRNKAQLHGRDNGNERKQLLEKFFIIKREIPFRFSVSSDLFGNARVTVRQFFAFTGFGCWFLILVLREQILTAGSLRVRILKPKAVDKIKVRAKWGKGIRSTANEDGEQIIGSKFIYPIGKTGKTTVKHEDKRA